VFGLLLIATNIKLIPRGISNIIISWQMVLIVIGVYSVVKRRGFHFHGFIFFWLGIFFIIPKVARTFPSVFGDLDTDFIRLYWPVLLIIVGIILIIHIMCKPSSPHYRRTNGNYSHFCHGHFHGEQGYFQNKEKYSNIGDFSKTSIFGNGQYIVIDTEFTGGTLNSVFGGIELDLRKAYLPEGDTFLNIEAVFGGVLIYIPDNWQLDVKLESVLGGVDDRHRFKVTDALDKSRKLIIKGSVVFGGVEIRN
jgi:predicted membrane protein